MSKEREMTKRIEKGGAGKKVARMRAKTLIIAPNAALAACLLLASGACSAQAQPAYYGAPYFDDYIYWHWSRPTRPLSNSVNEAYDTWWRQYQIDWPYAFPGCSAVITPGPAPQQDGRFLGFQLQGTCHGAGSIWGTKYTFDPEKSLGPEKCHAPRTHCGNPINVATGNKYQREDDSSDDSSGIEFVRHYNSHPAARSSAFGQNWTHSYSRKVELVGNATIDGAILHAYRDDGSMFRFKRVLGLWVGDVDGTAIVHATSSGWQIVEHDARTVEHYDSRGRLISIESLSGDSLQMTYNNGAVEGNSNDFRLTKIASTNGRRLALEYVGARISRAVLPDETPVDYVYDAEGRLEGAIYAGATQRRYHYNEPTLTSGASLKLALTGISDEAGVRFATFGYMGDGRALSTEHAGGVERFEVAYTQSGGATVKRATGSSMTYSFSILAGLKRPSIVPETSDGYEPRLTTYSYDLSGRIDEHAYGETVTDYDYDSRGRLVQRIDAKNDPATKRTVQTDWNSQFRVPIERRTYDATGVLKAKGLWTYNGRGQVLTATQLDPETGQARTSTTTYCEQGDITAGTCPLVGLVTSTDGPRTDVNDISSYQYYAADHADCATSPTMCAWRKGDLWKVTNALGQVTETLRYDGAGRVLSVKDDNGVITDFEYHPRGWLIAKKIRGSN